jgi:hypothetical protein
MRKRPTPLKGLQKPGEFWQTEFTHLVIFAGERRILLFGMDFPRLEDPSNPISHSNSRQVILLMETSQRANGRVCRQIGL